MKNREPLYPRYRVSSEHTSHRIMQQQLHQGGVNRGGRAVRQAGESGSCSRLWAARGAAQGSCHTSCGRLGVRPNNGAAHGHQGQGAHSWTAGCSLPVQVRNVTNSYCATATLRTVHAFVCTTPGRRAAQAGSWMYVLCMHRPVETQSVTEWCH